MADSQLNRFYPIVPDLAWLERALPTGIRLVQLRLKDAAPAEVDRQLRASVALCRAAGCTLVVNDYWQTAIDIGAAWVHLGQEDLATADVAALRRAGIRIGVSTHDEAELDTALAIAPDYVALGPVYPTMLKAMKWAPQGLARVADWKARIRCPLIAIGGITPERADGVIAAGADSVAVITDFVTHADPLARLGQWVRWSESATLGAKVPANSLT
jgi:thiamine-phosphate pyrophosphorylase